MAQKVKALDESVVNDGAYENLATGLGIKSMDKTENVHAKPYVCANLQELAAMAVKDGTAAFIVDGFPEAALMKDITITNDTDGSALKLFSSSGLRKSIKKAGSALRLTGGAVVVTEYEGDRKETIGKPAPASAKVVGYRVYSAGKVNLKKDDFDGEQPKVFRVKPIGGEEVEVHPSRCTVFHGKELPDVIDSTVSERYFGVSALAPVEDSLKKLAAVAGAIANMAEETGTLLMKMANLGLMLSKPDCGVQDVHRIMSMLKLCMNSMRAAFAGKDDGFEILSHNFAGLPEVWQKCQVDVSAKARIPMSIMFGQSATGLAQTNEGDIQTWCQSVDMWRSDYLYDQACRLIADLTRRNGTKEFSEFSWGAVDEMTLKQTLEAMKLQADTLYVHYNMGVIAPDEIRKSVFKNGHSWEVSVED